jgi:large subunit ribosomal protein L23
MRTEIPLLKRPLMSEKVTGLQDNQNQYAFEVEKGANKIEIKRAVEKRFNVKVTQVRTLNVLGKIKKMGRFSGRRPSWKKAIVTLKEGQKIEFFENI